MCRPLRPHTRTLPPPPQVGRSGASSDQVAQTVAVLPNDGAKWAWLLARVEAFAAAGKVLVFVGSKAGCEELTTNIGRAGIAALAGGGGGAAGIGGPVEAIHGDRWVRRRGTTLERVRARCTSVSALACRGPTRRLAVSALACRGPTRCDVRVR
jgi:hypothetical protein